jgi:dihydrofolate synthase / folylpolyglutamate synthase
MNKFNSDAYLSGLNVDVMHFGVEAITALLARFGNPQNSYKTILIGGTNGKGSTAAMAASILKQAGYRTGLYTSPHLVNVRERIAINGKIIPLRIFNGILAEIQNHVIEPVTYFEVLTAAAFTYFQRQQVDVAVMEVGLGGRLDATNVCVPLVSVITNIGLEHTAYLGNTLAAIAGEKAGIIKPAGVCITGITQQKVARKLMSICRRRKSALYRLGTDFKMVKRANGLPDYLGMSRRLSGLEIALSGRHQLSNAALALAALEIVETNGLVISDSAIRHGLKNTRWEARMEILSTRPLFLLDGAHNPAGINVLARALRNEFSWRRLILIFAALSDKDYEKMLKKMAPLAAVAILPPLETGRAVSPRRLAGVIKEPGCRPIMVDSVYQAVRLALEMTDDCDMICAAGSFYLAGEVKQIFPEIICCGKEHIVK